MAVVCMILMLFASGCYDSYKYQIEIVLPDLPAHLCGSGHDICFRLDYPGLPSDKEAVFYSPGDTAVISSDLPVLPVSAPACTASGTALYPAGGVYPEDYKKDGKLYLGWEDGFAAEIISNLITAGVSLENFNIGRFEKNLIEISCGNPWTLSEEEIVYALSFGIFNSNFVKKLETHDICLSLPYEHSENLWVLSNMLERRIFTRADRIVSVSSLPERNILLFPAMCAAEDKDCENNRYIEIFMDRGGWQAWFSGTTEIQSGSW